ncbi:MAG: hypothetical protein ACI4TL_05675 [Candidatus Cryptobacteroides sp.]
MKALYILLLAIGGIFNEMTPYHYEHEPLPSPPEGYEEVYLSHYGRHGSRTDNKPYRLESLLQVFENASKEALLTERGDSLYAELLKIYHYVSGHYGELCPLGEEQHSAIASRMALRHPVLFSSAGSRELAARSIPAVSARSTSYQRCRQSMNSFTGQLRCLYPSLPIDTLSGQENNTVLNFYNSKKMDSVLQERKEESLRKALEDSTFYLSQYFCEPYEALSYTCSAIDFLDALYFVAGMCPNLPLKADIQRFIPSGLLRICSEVNRDYLYGFCAWSSEWGLERMASCQRLCDDICLRADAALLGDGSQIDLRFGHDAPLLSLMCRLGVEGLEERSVQDLGDFCISDYIPMAANLQLIFYSCGEDVLLLCMVNERACKLNGLKAKNGYFYYWKEVRERLSLNPQILIEDQSRHVQGIAWDEEKQRIYLSFTTRLLICDKYGEILSSVDRIHGHLGALCFEPSARKIYASLECKGDEIGSSISKDLKQEGYSDSRFYIAEFDPDAILKGESQEMKLYEVSEAKKDYDSKAFGCSGIDGICIAEDKLLLAYGIYSDTSRVDNDNQVILRYSLSDLNKFEDKLFIPTGNTRYGVQNMAWDASSNKLLIAVYPGEKAAYPNWSFFQVDYTTLKVEKGWHYPAAATGFCKVGDKQWYVAYRLKDKSKDKAHREGASVRLSNNAQIFKL